MRTAAENALPQGHDEGRKDGAGFRTGKSSTHPQVLIAAPITAAENSINRCAVPIP